MFLYKINLYLLTYLKSTRWSKYAEVVQDYLIITTSVVFKDVGIFGGGWGWIEFVEDDMMVVVLTA